ncbi:hypothetical protein NDI37_23935 [Funiculus sociatus GB2-A5]|uniref:Uncharacterized protein n=1 Tax=Funiculus sociatus GB2-A5 TaxID=2933946 RepID=A0ABV0JVM3_9CYAN|nr:MULTISPECIES: hypothetical protein [unclassified Trichocoleus]MBD1906667.1 hypothetical protein [Trichocoleus sp. FACHB-832]MBD2063777.1 hypothetical protein [Trichocoleus sp. FACHB-6]
MFDQQEFYALEEGEPPRLAISWGFFSREIVIRLDGEEIGSIPRAKLSKLHEFVLKDGSRLKIKQIPSFKILGMGFQPYLHLSLDGRDLPGLIPNPQQRLSTANGWIFGVGSAKLILAIFMPVKAIALPQTLQFRELVEWQQGFTGSMITGLILLGLFVVPKHFTKLVLTAALIIIVGNLILEFSCVWVCTARTGHIAALEGLAALSIYQALRTQSRSHR